MAGSAWRAAALGAALILAAISGCSGGSSGSAGTGGCTGECQAPQNFLTVADVQRVIAQAAGEAQARNAPAVITVVDRVGNVLAIYEMTGAPATIGITSGLGVRGGLDGIESGLVPAALSSIAKAVTGAFLSSEGNAFTTRTASQIVQEHFLPHELGQPSGPLFGVQFSQLTCSDVSRNQTHGTIGPQRSPLGLSADPGGLPLYKNGTVVGGIGVEADGVYTIDRNIQDIDQDVEELIAVAGGSGFAAPTDRRADRITAGGVTLRYVDSEALASNPAQAPAFAAIAGRLLPVGQLLHGHAARRHRLRHARLGHRRGRPPGHCRPWAGTSSSTRPAPTASRRARAPTASSPPPTSRRSSWKRCGSPTARARRSAARWARPRTSRSPWWAATATSSASRARATGRSSASTCPRRRRAARCSSRTRRVRR